MIARRGWSRRFYPVLYAAAEVLFLPALFIGAYLVVVFIAAATDRLPK